MKSNPTIYLQYACNELLPHLQHIQIGLNYRAYVLPFTYPTFSIRTADIIGFQAIIYL